MATETCCICQHPARPGERCPNYAEHPVILSAARSAAAADSADALDYSPADGPRPNYSPEARPVYRLTGDRSLPLAWFDRSGRIIVRRGRTARFYVPASPRAFRRAANWATVPTLPNDEPFADLYRLTRAIVAASPNKWAHRRTLRIMFDARRADVRERRICQSDLVDLTPVARPVKPHNRWGSRHIVTLNGDYSRPTGHALVVVGQHPRPLNAATAELLRAYFPGLSTGPGGTHPVMPAGRHAYYSGSVALVRAGRILDTVTPRNLAPSGNNIGGRGRQATRPKNVPASAERHQVAGTDRHGRKVRQNVWCWLAGDSVQAVDASGFRYIISDKASSAVRRKLTGAIEL